MVGDCLGCLICCFWVLDACFGCLGFVSAILLWFACLVDLWLIVFVLFYLLVFDCCLFVLLVWFVWVEWVLWLGFLLVLFVLDLVSDALILGFLIYFNVAILLASLV